MAGTSIGRIGIEDGPHSQVEGMVMPRFDWLMAPVIVVSDAFFAFLHMRLPPYASRPASGCAPYTCWPGDLAASTPDGSMAR